MPSLLPFSPSLHVVFFDILSVCPMLFYLLWVTLLLIFFSDSFANVSASLFINRSCFVHVRKKLVLLPKTFLIWSKEGWISNNELLSIILHFSSNNGVKRDLFASLRVSYLNLVYLTVFTHSERSALGSRSAELAFWASVLRQGKARTGLIFVINL